MTNHNMYNQNHYWDNHWQNPQYRGITIDQAMAIALQRVPGQVVKAELDNDDGMLIYEVDVRTEQGVKYEVNIDAVTGEILRVKMD